MASFHVPVQHAVDAGRVAHGPAPVHAAVGADRLRGPKAVRPGAGRRRGLLFDDRGPILWLRTIEGVWLAADLEAPYWWTLDVNCMPVVDMAHLHAVTLAEAQALLDTVEAGEPNPMDTYDGIAATFGE